MPYYIEVHGKTIEYEIKRTKRKTYGISVSAGGKVTVKIPMRGSITYAKQMVKGKRDWIYDTVEKLADVPVKPLESEKSEYEKRLEAPYRAAAKDYIPQRVAYYANLLGVTYGAITIRDQKTRWGSCSSKGNLNFNWRLMLAPPKVLDYVVIHELCHRLEMNHSPRFWSHVASIMPDYKEHRLWLKQNGKNLTLN